MPGPHHRGHPARAAGQTGAAGSALACAAIMDLAAGRGSRLAGSAAGRRNWDGGDARTAVGPPGATLARRLRRDDVKRAEAQLPAGRRAAG